MGEKAINGEAEQGGLGHQAAGAAGQVTDTATDPATDLEGSPQGKVVPIPATEAALGELTQAELSGLAGAVVAEQHRRSGAAGRRARTAAARAAAQALDPTARAKQTAAAREARQRKRNGT